MLAGLGDLQSRLGRNEQARTAYDEARTLYKQESNRLGEANVLRGLGDLESGLGRNEQARTAYDVPDVVHSEHFRVVTPMTRPLNYSEA